MRFEPKPHDILAIEDRYEVAPHPVAPHMAFAQTAGKSTVYQVWSTGTGQPFALKVFHEAYRNADIYRTAQRIKKYADMPGMAVCNRLVVTKPRHAGLIARYPDLEFAVLMPWVGDATWSEVIEDGRKQRRTLSADQAFAVAMVTANLLTRLEERGLAHCDLAGSNVLVDRLDAPVPGVYLVDVEEIFSTDGPQPKKPSTGTQGYNHRSGRMTSAGQWCREGDRFAGAVLLAEMLCWHDATIVNAAYGETYFAPSDMHDPRSDRYQHLLDALDTTVPECVALFRSAWLSPNLSACPCLYQWAEVLLRQAERQAATTEWNRAVASRDDRRIVAVYGEFGPFLSAHASVAEAARQRIAASDAALVQLRAALRTGDPALITGIYTRLQDLLEQCPGFGPEERSQVDAAVWQLARQRTVVLQKALRLDDDARIADAFADCAHLAEVLTDDEHKRVQLAQARMAALGELRVAMAARDDHEIVRIWNAQQALIESCSAFTAAESRQVRTSAENVTAIALAAAMRSPTSITDVVARGDAAAANGWLTDEGLRVGLRDARRLQATLQRLQDALQAGDDWAILLSYDPELLDGSSFLTPAQHQRVADARRRLL